jgi:hypothetical protein
MQYLLRQSGDDCRCRANETAGGSSGVVSVSWFDTNRRDYEGGRWGGKYTVESAVR